MENGEKEKENGEKTTSAGGKYKRAGRGGKKGRGKKKSRIYGEGEKKENAWKNIGCRNMVSEEEKENGTYFVERLLEENVRKWNGQNTPSGAKVC